MKKRIAALVLVLCLILAACSGREKENQSQTSFLGEATGLDEEVVLLTVDGREVPAWRYLYWLAYTCQQVQEQYQESGLPLDWAAPVSGGTLADYARDQALADTALYATVENWAEQYGCTATEGEEQETSYLPDMGLSAERMRELERVGWMYAALYELYSTEGSELAPTEEALAAYGEAQGAVTLDRILIPFGENQDAAQARAAEVFSEINGAEDQAAVFSALAAEGDDRTGPRTVLPEDGQLDPALLEAVHALQEGQVSGILESMEGFSILRRLPLDTSALKEAYFDHLLQTAAEQAAVTTMPEYQTVDPAAFTSGKASAENGSGE